MPFSWLRLLLDRHCVQSFHAFVATCAFLVILRSHYSHQLQSLRALLLSRQEVSTKNETVTFSESESLRNMPKLEMHWEPCTPAQERSHSGPTDQVSTRIWW